MKAAKLAILTAVAVAVTGSSADAGLGQFLKTGFKYLTKQGVDAADDAAEAGAKTVLRESGEAGAEAASRLAVKQTDDAISGLGRVSGAITLRSADEATEMIVHSLGKNGLTSLERLSPSGISKMADVAVELSANPYRDAWLTTLRAYGDEAADFLWHNKGSLAIAATGTAVALAPEAFLLSTGRVVETAVSSASEHIMDPLVTQTAEHVAGPVAREVTRQAAANFPWTLAFSLMFMGVAGGLGYLLIAKR
jgi:hypothetical protein